MSIPLRLLASGLATALGQWALAVASLLAMGLEPTTWWLGLSGVLTTAVSVWAFRLVRRPRDDGESEGEGEGPGGGPEDPPEPPWWPEFERALRAHTSSSPAPERTPA